MIKWSLKALVSGGISECATCGRRSGRRFLRPGRNLDCDSIKEAIWWQCAGAISQVNHTTLDGERLRLEQHDGSGLNEYCFALWSQFCFDALVVKGMFAHQHFSNRADVILVKDPYFNGSDFLRIAHSNCLGNPRARFAKEFAR